MSQDNIVPKVDQPQVHFPNKKITLGEPTGVQTFPPYIQAPSFSEMPVKMVPEPIKMPLQPSMPNYLDLKATSNPNEMLHSIANDKLILGPVINQTDTMGISKSAQEPRLENIVSTVNLDCELDLRKIALHAKNAEYNPKRFAAVIMRIREPRTTALIFRSGKMVCTGAKSETDSETAAKKYAKTIKKLGFDVKFKEFTIQNIVGSCSVNYAINLEVLQNSSQKFCTYDPEIFPGLIYRMERPKIVLLIFCSGKVVLTGAKKREDLSLAFERIRAVLFRCQKKDISKPQ